VTLAVGIDIGATKIAAGVVDVERGYVCASRFVASDIDRGGAAVLEDCVKLARGLAAGSAIAAVGIGVCELVDVGGSVTGAGSFDWRGIDLPAAFDHLAPAVVESDVRAAARAESAYGAGRDHASFLYVNAGSGISSTLVLDGTPYAGARGNAILIGAGPLNVEAAASGVGLRARYGSSAEELDRAAAGGDESAAYALEDAGAALGEAIAFAINLLDPEVVVLGGGLALGSRLYSTAAERAMRAQIWADSARGIPFLRAALGGEAGMIGAALTATTTLRPLRVVTRGAAPK